jgi:endonuclease YncB( thermonuclease family)
MAGSGGSRALVALLGILLAAWVVGVVDDEERDEGADRARSERTDGNAERRDRGPRPSTVPRGPRETGTQPGRRARTVVVARVVDGDTVDLSDGRTVRLAGIDTPEVGECGYRPATAALERLVLGRRVRLVASDEDRDRYGRLLRYLDVRRDGRTVDAGYVLVRRGLAIARYDSRDGYGRHPREARYVAADRLSPDPGCRKGVRGLVGQQPEPRAGCAVGYSPCVPPYPPDVDCADVDGPVRVSGRDPHGLDADGDGWGCES